MWQIVIIKIGIRLLLQSFLMQHAWMRNDKKFIIFIKIKKNFNFLRQLSLVERIKTGYRTLVFISLSYWWNEIHMIYYFIVIMLIKAVIWLSLCGCKFIVIKLLGPAWDLLEVWKLDNDTKTSEEYVLYFHMVCIVPYIQWYYQRESSKSETEIHHLAWAIRKSELSTPKIMPETPGAWSSTFFLKRKTVLSNPKLKVSTAKHTISILR